MKSVWENVRWLLLAGGAPCLGLMLGSFLAFLIYPDDVNNASKLLVTFAGTGAMVGIFLIVHRMRYLWRNR